MEIIRNRDGVVIGRSRNLRGIRRYVGQTRSPIRSLAIDRIGSHEGKLALLFDDGVSFETNFASFKALQDFVANWRNVHGAPFWVNGKPVGVVAYKHSALA